MRAAMWSSMPWLRSRKAEFASNSPTWRLTIPKSRNIGFLVALLTVPPGEVGCGARMAFGPFTTSMRSTIAGSRLMKPP